MHATLRSEARVVIDDLPWFGRVERQAYAICGVDDQPFIDCLKRAI